MKKNLKWMLLLVLLAALIAGAYLLYDSLKDSVSLDNLVAETTAHPVGTTAPTPAHTGYITPTPLPLAPDFTVVDGSGNEVTLSSLRGKPVVLNFWASWCGPCQAEMPALQTGYDRHGDQVQFLFINLTDGQQETVESASAFITKKGYTFPVYYDTKLEAAIAYGVNSVPRTYFIDANGGLVARVSGGISLATLERGLAMISN